jgi:hypothetical protein
VTSDRVLGGIEAPPWEPTRGMTDDADDVSRAPVALLGVLAVELAMCAALFGSSSRIGHAVGYLLGAVLVACTVVCFRTVDRARRRSPRYVIRPHLNWLATGGLIVGIALAVAHSWYFFQHTAVV